jgi:hypothetical protein
MKVGEWDCEDCGKDCFKDEKDYYMIQHDLWEKHGVGRGMICMDCIEDRLGRKINAADILICPITTMFNPYTIKILNDGKV